MKRLVICALLSLSLLVLPGCAGIVGQIAAWKAVLNSYDAAVSLRRDCDDLEVFRGNGGDRSGSHEGWAESPSPVLDRDGVEKIDSDPVTREAVHGLDRIGPHGPSGSMLGGTSVPPDPSRFCIIPRRNARGKADSNGPYNEPTDTIRACSTTSSSLRWQTRSG